MAEVHIPCKKCGRGFATPLPLTDDQRCRACGGAHDLRLPIPAPEVPQDPTRDDRAFYRTFLNRSCPRVRLRRQQSGQKTRGYGAHIWKNRRREFEHLYNQWVGYGRPMGNPSRWFRMP